MKNYYKILGINKKASPEEIRKAYRNLALQFHPDRNGSDNQAEVFKDINEAKQVLLDQHKRGEYDQMLASGRQGIFAARAKGYPYNEDDQRYFRYSTIPKKPVYVAVFLILLAFGVIYLITQTEYEMPVQETASFEIPLQVLTDTGLLEVSTMPVEQNTALAQVTDPIQDSINMLLSSTLPGLDRQAETTPQNKQAVATKIEKQELTSTSKPQTTVVATPDKKEPAAKVVTATTALPQQPKPAEAVKKQPVSKPLSPAVAATTTPIRQQQVVKTSIPKSSVTKPKESSSATAAAAIKAAPAPAKPAITKVEKELSTTDMQEVLANIAREKNKYGNNSRCVQIRKTAGSNASNGFKLAEFLRKNGFILSGRETVSGNQQGIKIDAKEGCVKVTVGVL